MMYNMRARVLPESAERPNIPRGTVITLVVFVLACVGLGSLVGEDLPELHTILDTAMFVLSGTLALLLWDIGRRLDRPFKKHLSITFAAVAALELLHSMVSVEWSGPLAGIALVSADLRPLTWPPPALLLPIGICASLLLLTRGVRSVGLFALATALGAAALFALFQNVPPYSLPEFLGISRPSLIPVPLLWGVVVWQCWLLRGADRAIPSLGLMAATLLAASIFMLYSRYPPDPLAIIAHLGRVAAYVALLFSLMHMASLDMLERAHAEAELRRLNEDLDARVKEQTALLGAITDNTPAVIYVKDLEGRYLMINPRFAEIFRLDPASVIGKTDYDLFDKPAADAFRAMDERVAAADAALSEQEVAPQPDGLHTYISVKAPLRDARGKPYAVFGISTDITEVKRAQGALAESEERSRLIVETALDAVIGMNATGDVIEWSPQAVATFGWTREEALGRPLAGMIVPERHRGGHAGGLKRYLETGETQVLNQRIDLKVFRFACADAAFASARAAAGSIPA